MLKNELCLATRQSLSNIETSLPPDDGSTSRPIDNKQKSLREVWVGQVKVKDSTVGLETPNKEKEQVHSCESD